MKNCILFVLILFITSVSFSQNNADQNDDGIIDLIPSFNPRSFDLNGDGIIGNDFKFYSYKSSFRVSDNVNSLSFSSMWTSPAGAFSNCWDGVVGYFDNDTLLDIAGYTFSPGKFYVWEQTISNPDSFALVTEITKAEGGGFGPITVGDTDGDGKTEIILADFATFTRIYIYENNGDNIYVSQNTQGTLTHGTPSRTARGLMIGDLNKNGKKEIICTRGNSSNGGMVRVWEHSGTVGSNTYTNIHTYTTVSYIFGKGGIGDSDNDGWDEVFITYGGFPTYNTYIRRIEYDSASATFNHLMYQASSIGLPTSYRVKDVNNDGIDELVATHSSNGIATLYIHKSTGPNQYHTIDSVFESSDNSTMLNCDIKLLTGRTYPTVLSGSHGGKVYMHEYNGTSFIKQYEKLDYPGPAVRRVYWFFNNGKDGYFNTWSGGSSNGTFYLFKREGASFITSNGITSKSFRLYQNYPNPFNPTTNIKFDIVHNANVRISIYNILGEKVSEPLNKRLAAGSYEVTWDGTKQSSGVYFYRVETSNHSEIKSMVLAK